MSNRHGYRIKELTILWLNSVTAMDGPENEIYAYFCQSDYT